MLCQTFDHDACLFHTYTNYPFLRLSGMWGCEVETGSNYVAQLSLELRMTFYVHLSSCLRFPGCRMLCFSSSSQPCKCSSNQSQPNTWATLPLNSFLWESNDDRLFLLQTFDTWNNSLLATFIGKIGCSGQCVSQFVSYHLIAYHINLNSLILFYL